MERLKSGESNLRKFAVNILIIKESFENKGNGHAGMRMNLKTASAFS